MASRPPPHLNPPQTWSPGSHRGFSYFPGMSSRAPLALDVHESLAHAMTTIDALRRLVWVLLVVHEQELLAVTARARGHRPHDAQFVSVRHGVRHRSCGVQR